MVNITVSGEIDKEKFEGLGDKNEKKIFTKLEIVVKAGQPESIEASDLNVLDLRNVILLLLRTKDNKYDSNLYYSLVFEDNNSKPLIRKLNSSTILWISLDKDLQLFNAIKSIKSIELSIEEEETSKDSPASPTAEKKSPPDVTVEILALRRIASKSSSNEEGDNTDGGASIGGRKGEKKTASTNTGGASEVSLSTST